MQNKPNFPDTQMNATYVKRKNYEQNTMEAEPAKQSQNKPNQSQFPRHWQRAFSEDVWYNERND
jgi:hypothetical protein